MLHNEAGETHRNNLKMPFSISSNSFQGSPSLRWRPTENTAKLLGTLQPNRERARATVTFVEMKKNGFKY